MERKFTTETKMKLEISEKEYVLLPGQTVRGNEL